jgi:hypothetical protein
VLVADASLRQDAGSEAPVLGTTLSPRLCAALGYPVCGGLAVRADLLEAVGREIARGDSVQRVAARLGLAAPSVTALVAEVRAAGVGHGRARRSR